VPAAMSHVRDEGMLSSLLETGSILRGLSEAQRETLIAALEGPLNIRADTELLPAGHLSEHLYLVETGELMGRHKLAKGDCFGELSLLRKIPLSSSVWALSDCSYWRLDKETFDGIVAPSLDERNERRQGLLGRVNILSTLSDGEMYTLAHHCSEDTHPEAATVCRQGEGLASLLVVGEGALELLQVDGEGEERVVSSLGPGDAFAETALLEHFLATATVKTTAATTVLRLDRATLVQHLGPLDSMLKRNMEVYGKYIEQAVN
jgi:CRP-like cAMP-binding protein